MSQDVLSKVIETTTIGAAGGGLLNTEQQNRFLDYAWDATVLGGEARTVRLKSDTADIDKVGVGERLMRVATEAVDDGVNVGATFSKISLTTTKMRLDWELSTESLEDNLEGAALEDHIARLMANQVGNDLEDLSINGDSAATTDPFLKAFDGWSKRAVAGAHVVDAAGAGVGRPLFNSALKAMPRKYLQRRNQLKFYSGSNLIQDYLFSLADKETTPEDIASAMIRTGPQQPAGPAGFVSGYAFGVPVQEVPLFDETLAGTYLNATGEHGNIVLTFPQNRLWGIKRDVTVYREFKPKKDTIEYTTYVRTGVAWENLDAVVVVTNVKVAA